MVLPSFQIVLVLLYQIRGASAAFGLSFDNFPVAVFVGANAADFSGCLKVLHLSGNPARRYQKKIGKFHFRDEWICPHILLYLLGK
jgi:hypothetical protein